MQPDPDYGMYQLVIQTYSEYLNYFIKRNDSVRVHYQNSAIFLQIHVSRSWKSKLKDLALTIT